MTWGNWAIVADLATALGTLVLAVATFSAVKSANLTADPRYEPARKVIEARHPWTVELLYGDHEGGQRRITWFTMLPRERHDQPTAPEAAPASDAGADPATGPATEKGWFASQSRHWNIDRPDPR